MNDHILNIISHLLCYGDNGVTDSPYQRAFDHRLRLDAIAVKNPFGSSKTLAPGESFSIFSTTIPHSMTNSTTLSLKILDANKSTYRLSIDSGPGAFRTARSVSGITNCNVSVNNGVMATFDFPGSTLTSVQVGDLMKVNGQETGDTGPFAFNPINSGIWKIIGISGSKISVTREAGIDFTALSESVLLATSDVIFFADDGVRAGNKVQISGTFSPVSFKTVEVQTSTPSTLDFISTEPLPEEISLSYISGTITIYTSIKKMVYIEVDQECSVRFNGAIDDSNRITPIKAGDRFLKGFLQKMGDTYSCEVVNKSVAACVIKFFTVE